VHNPTKLAWQQGPLIQKLPTQPNLDLSHPSIEHLWNHSMSKVQHSVDGSRLTGGWKSPSFLLNLNNSSQTHYCPSNLLNTRINTRDCFLWGFSYWSRVLTWVDLKPGDTYIYYSELLSRNLILLIVLIDDICIINSIIIYWSRFNILITILLTPTTTNRCLMCRWEVRLTALELG
jgi:hypothetical protein